MNDWLLEDGPRLPLFVSSFAKAASGGAVDDPDDDDDDDSDDDDDDDEDPDEGKTDEELRAELKAVRESLSKANGQSAKRRKALRAKEAELVEARKPKAPKKDGEAVDVDAIRAEARRDAETAADNRVKKAEAKAALIAAGVPRDQAADLVAFVKLDDLDLDEDGVDGLDEEIDRIKRRYPTFFAKTRQRRESVAGKGDRDGDAGPRKKPLSASERQAARALGRG